MSQACAIFLETDVEMAIYNQMKISEIRKRKRGKSTEIRKIGETEGQEESERSDIEDSLLAIKTDSMRKSQNEGDITK